MTPADLNSKDKKRMWEEGITHNGEIWVRFKEAESKIKQAIQQERERCLNLIKEWDYSWKLGDKYRNNGHFDFTREIFFEEMLRDLIKKINEVKR